jgi:hypothetical protein
MSIFTSMGDGAVKSAERDPMKFIKLEDGKSIRVRVPDAHPLAEYPAHGDFNLGIFPTACIAGLGDGCPMCVAQKSGVEGFDKLYAKQRYLFFFWDLDAGAFLPFDATKQQAKDIMSDIKEYADSLDEIAFTFKRTGQQTATKYGLSPILKPSADDKAKFAAMPADGLKPEMFESALQLREKAQMIADLQKAGFPVEEFFPPAPFANTNGDLNP